MCDPNKKDTHPICPMHLFLLKEDAYIHTHTQQKKKVRVDHFCGGSLKTEKKRKKVVIVVQYDVFKIIIGVYHYHFLIGFLYKRFHIKLEIINRQVFFVHFFVKCVFPFHK